MVRNRTRWMLAAAAVLLSVFGINRIEVYAEGEEFYFDSEEHTWTLQEESSIGVHIKSDDPIEAVELTVRYDAEMLEYNSGADREREGVLSLHAQAGLERKFDSTLYFTPKSPGETEIQVTQVTVEYENGETEDVPGAAALVKIPLDGGTLHEDAVEVSVPPESRLRVINAADDASGNRIQWYLLLFGFLMLAVFFFLAVIFIRSNEKKRRRRRRKRRRRPVGGQGSPYVRRRPGNSQNGMMVRKEHRTTLKPGEKVEIAVRNVTMEFKREKDEPTSIKELLIRKLKRQVSYEKFKALDNVSFTVDKGEVVGIIGTNGSGKSTILKIISGVLTPTKGKVYVDKNKIQLLTLGTGFDFELTGRENVYLNGAIIGYTKEFIDEKYDDIVRFAELEGFMEEKVRNYSSGMVSRLGFAIATIGDAPEILILDEVLSVGDMFFRRKSEERIREMMHGGSTVLIVSHSTSVIEKNCTKAVWIERGKLRAVGDPKEVCAEYEKMGQKTAE